MKILYYGETPVIETGAAQVSKQILSLMAEMGHQVSIVPISHWHELNYDRTAYPYTFYPCSWDSDLYNKANVEQHIRVDDYDLLFLTGDIHLLDGLMDAVLDAKRVRSFVLVVYVAIDKEQRIATPCRLFSMADIPVVFTMFGKREAIHLDPVSAEKIRVIYHGDEPNVFSPLSEQERQRIRKQTFHCDPDTFLVVNVNRNIPRKDLPRSMYAFHLFHQQHPDSRLYLHAARQDRGGHLPLQAYLLGLDIRKGEVLFAHADYSSRDGCSRAMLNEFYNAADVCISTSQGEGWGLTTTEAMAAGTPFIGPHNSAFPELLGEQEERGYLVESGGSDLWFMGSDVGALPCPLTSVTGMVEALEHVYTHREEAREKAKTARQWTQEHAWGHVREQWRAVFCEAAERSMELVG